MTRDVRVGDRVRNVHPEWITVDGRPVRVPPDSLATVSYVYRDGYLTDVHFDGYPVSHETECSTHSSEYEWVERPEPKYPLQRRCDTECDGWYGACDTHLGL